MIINYNDSIWRYRSESTLPQVITWTIVDWPSAWSSGFHPSALSYEFLKISISKTRLGTIFTLHPNLPWTLNCVTPHAETCHGEPHMTPFCVGYKILSLNWNVNITKITRWGNSSLTSLTYFMFATIRSMWQLINIIFMNSTFKNRSHISKRQLIALFLAITRLRRGQTSRHIAYDTLKCIFLNAYLRNLTQISMKSVLKSPTHGTPSLDEVMTTPNRLRSIIWCKDDRV